MHQQGCVNKWTAAAAAAAAWWGHDRPAASGSGPFRVLASSNHLPSEFLLWISFFCCLVVLTVETNRIYSRIAFMSECSRTVKQRSALRCSTDR